jgi:hypothetical protein
VFRTGNNGSVFSDHVIMRRGDENVLAPRSDEISTAFGFHGNDKLTNAALHKTN